MPWHAFSMPWHALYLPWFDKNYKSQIHQIDVEFHFQSILIHRINILFYADFNWSCLRVPFFGDEDFTVYLWSTLSIAKKLWRNPVKCQPMSFRVCFLIKLFFRFLPTFLIHMIEIYENAFSQRICNILTFIAPSKGWKLNPGKAKLPCSVDGGTSIWEREKRVKSIDSFSNWLTGVRSWLFRNSTTHPYLLSIPPWYKISRAAVSVLQDGFNGVAASCRWPEEGH